jgi:hypothetical protein
MADINVLLQLLHPSDEACKDIQSPIPNGVTDIAHLNLGPNSKVERATQLLQIWSLTSPFFLHADA